MSRKDFATFWTWVADRYGVPMLVLFAVGYAGWCIAAWVAPIGERVATKHVEFLDQCTVAQKTIAEVLIEMKAENVRTHDLLQEIKRAVVDRRFDRPGGLQFDRSFPAQEQIREP